MRAISVFLLLLPIAAAASAAETDEPRTAVGVFSLTAENDWFVGSDSRYTNGISAAWTSGDVAGFGPRSFFARMVRAFGWVPTVDDERYANFVAFALGHEMYTPDDINDPDPPPDAQPYAGIVAVDTSLYSKTPHSLHQYKLRVGLVGPSAGAEWLQTKLHELLGADIPQGWDTQLADELLLNLDYQYNRRLLRRAAPRKFGYDLTASGGMGLGNYFTGANASFAVRFGRSLPDTYGTFDIRAGHEALVGYEPAPGRWQAHAFVHVNVLGIVRFLPTDGNTWKESRSTPRDDFLETVTVGFVAGTRRLLFTLAYNAVMGDRRLPGLDEDDYATIGMSYVFGGTPPSE